MLKESECASIIYVLIKQDSLDIIKTNLFFPSPVPLNLYRQGHFSSATEWKFDEDPNHF